MGNKTKWAHTAITIRLYDSLYVLDRKFSLGKTNVQLIPWSEWVINVDKISVFDPKVQPIKFNRKLVDYPGNVYCDECADFVAKIFEIEQSILYTPEQMYSLRYKNFKSGDDVYVGDVKGLKWLF